MRSCAALPAWGCVLLAPACISSSVVESTGRAVASATPAFAWRPTTSEDLDGFFESVSIEGEAAGALWKVYYVFSAGGSYSGAALVLGAVHPEFQTLSGTWTLEGEVLDLGDGQTVRPSTATGHLRLETDGGVVILRRAAVP